MSMKNEQRLGCVMITPMLASKLVNLMGISFAIFISGSVSGKLHHSCPSFPT
ncbi:hypothetical protein ACVBIL_00040 [Shewanella sp. 125m-7]